MKETNNAEQMIYVASVVRLEADKMFEGGLINLLAKYQQQNGTELTMEDLVVEIWEMGEGQSETLEIGDIIQVGIAVMAASLGIE